MKKHLFLGSALVAAISAYSQNASLNRTTKAVNMADRIAQKFANINKLAENGSAANTNYSAPSPAAQSVSGLRTSNTTALAIDWKKFTGSMNIYGMLVSSSKPLQYHDDLNVITFVHRKSATYAPSPTPATTGAATGALVAMVSQNMGSTWDSTCVWNDNNNWARYPQGGILSGAGNTSLANASIVATAPITQANTNLGWIGMGYAAKPATSFNNTAASQTFVANSSPYTGLDVKADFVRHDFTSTDDGYVYALGQIFGGDVNATTVAGQDYRGARIVRGEFSSGQVLWTTDSIIPDVRTSVATGKMLSSVPGMAWSEDGQTGYVYHFGARQPAFASDTADANRGWQPIIWKTTDAGQNWQQVPNHINFNDPSMLGPVLNHVPSTSTNSNVTIPFFDVFEGISATVDYNNNLHLVSMILPSFSPDPDSSAYTINFTNYDGEAYHYLHQNGARPYVYDFTGDGVGTWSVTLIDSLPSEGPGTQSTDDGYSSNPWDATGGTGTDKIDVDARIQVSRTPDGKNIFYTWAETDSTLNATPSSTYLKWNTAPSVIARYMEVSASGMSLSPTEVPITRIAGTSGSPNSSVNNRGFNHYIAPTAAENMTASTTQSFVVNMPITVSNSPAQLEQLNPVNHWYSTAPLFFLRSTPSSTTSISESNMSASNSMIYPNPAKNNATLAIDLKSNSKVDIAVMNVVGQTVKTTKAEGQIGANTINIDLSGLSKGIYMVNVKIDNATSTKKLIVE